MKQYNNEKAIISLTSWKARICTVSKTIYSLIKKCPGFHIVLVLSEEEFPEKEKELPDELMLIVNSNLIEILWVKKNYKAFKKVLFTIKKYTNIPVISADDDCIYTCNYAEKLYNVYKTKNNYCIIRYTIRNMFITQGPCTLYYIRKRDAERLIEELTEEQIRKSRDDKYYYTKLRNYRLYNTGTYKLPFIFHDNIEPLTKNQKNSIIYKKCFKQ